MQNHASISHYILGFPRAVQTKLRQMRKAIRATAPKAEEKIKYGIPTFVLNGKNLVHFGGFKHHVSFFPGSRPIQLFAKELKNYKTTKGTVRFSLDQPLPIALIQKITKYNLKQLTKIS